MTCNIFGHFIHTIRIYLVSLDLFIMKTLSMKVLVVLLIFGSSSLVLYSCILDGDSDFKTLTDSDSSSKIFTPKANSTNLPAEDFELTLLSGESLKLSNYRGKVIVLNFWASWCPPCRWEMPSFERVWKEYQGLDVMFIGIAISDRKEDAIEFVESVGVTYPIGLDTTGYISELYSIVHMPTTYFIDRDGNVARKLINVANEGVLQVFLRGQQVKK